MLDQLSGFLGSGIKSEYDDGTVDRLNYLWTSFLLTTFAVLVGLKQYLTDPLQCWIPAQFKGGWEEYVENYCFVENTYWVPVENRLPNSTDVRASQEIQYYQWVPFVFAIQAILFYIPRILWKSLSKISGVDVSSMVESIQQAKSDGGKKSLIIGKSRDETVKAIALHLHTSLSFNTRTVGSNTTRSPGIFITLSYLLSKFLWIINVVGQFFLLNSFLGPEYNWWGVGILRDLINGRQWEQSGHFPRVTFCDFEVRRLGNLHRFSVQCVLQMNMFNEKLYLFLWFWFLVVAICTCIDFVYWAIVAFLPVSHKEFLRGYLQAKGKLEGTAASQDKLEEFTSDVVKADGVTVLKLMSHNAGDLAVADVIGDLWDIKYPRDSNDLQ